MVTLQPDSLDLVERKPFLRPVVELAPPAISTVTLRPALERRPAV